MLRVSTLVVCLLFLLCQAMAFADTVYLKNDEEVKGIVVEEYVDRIVLSTYEGEKTFFKKRIEKIVYDMQGQNFMKLGDACMARREYGKAYFYYEKAHKANPRDKIVLDRLNYVMGHLFRQREQDKLSDVQRKEECEAWPKPPTRSVKNVEKSLENTIGIRIVEGKNHVNIENVRRGSPAFRAGLRKGDVLISVWGRLVGYMAKEAVMRLLLEESSGELKMCIEREVGITKEAQPNANYKKIIEGKISMLINGITLVNVQDTGPGYKAGLRKDDLVVDINGEPTRYMPLKEAIRLIEDSNADMVVFKIRRDVTVWRK